MLHVFASVYAFISTHCISTQEVNSDVQPGNYFHFLGAILDLHVTFYNSLTSISSLQQNWIHTYSITEPIQYIYSAIPDIPSSFTPTLQRRINTPVLEPDAEAEKKGMSEHLYVNQLALPWLYS